MQTNRVTITLAAVLLFTYCSALAGRGMSAAPDVGAKTAIRELQKQRLEALTSARDYLVRQLRSDDLATAVNTNGFTNQLLGANELVFQARLDLCDNQAERTKVIESTIQEFGPVLAVFVKHFQAGIVDSTVPYRLAQAHLLQLRIALEKTKQETGGR